MGLRSSYRTKTHRRLRVIVARSVAQASRVRQRHRGPGHWIPPWAAPYASVGLGTTAGVGFDPLAGHVKGIDRRLGHHGGGARSAPRVRDLDHIPYHAAGSAIERVLVQDSHRSPAAGSASALKDNRQSHRHSFPFVIPVVSSLIRIRTESPAIQALETQDPQVSTGE